MPARPPSLLTTKVLKLHKICGEGGGGFELFNMKFEGVLTINVLPLVVISRTSEMLGIFHHPTNSPPIIDWPLNK
jgi:hypothetical protein